MYVYVYVHVYGCAYVYVYVYVSVYAYAHVYVHVCVHESIGFGGMDGAKPYEFMVWGNKWPPNPAKL